MKLRSLGGGYGRRLAGIALALAALTGATFGGIAYERHEAAITARITASIVGSETSVQDLGTATFPATLSFTSSLTNGVAVNQADVLWSDIRTLTASSTENLDLAGVLVNAFGATVTFAKVKAIMVTAACANTNNVEVGGAGANAFIGIFKTTTDVVAIKPCYAFLVGGGQTGYTVTPGTVDLLKVTNSAAGTSVTYSIAVLGTTS